MSLRHVLGIILAALGATLWFAGADFNARHLRTALAQTHKHGLTNAQPVSGALLDE